MVVPHDPTTQRRLFPLGSWYIDDDVVQLRRWAGEDIYGLDRSAAPLKLGSGFKSAIRIIDRTRRLSREHASLELRSGRWRLHDLRSTNGTLVDGKRITSASSLPAGAVVQVGDVILVAESPRLLELRSQVARFIGWSNAEEIDIALQLLRDYATRRTPLVLHGEEDLRVIATRLHRACLGPAATVQLYRKGNLHDALSDASEGALYTQIRSRTTINKLAASLREMGAGAPHVMLCTRTKKDVASIVARMGRPAVITIPPLATRGDQDIRRLIDDTVSETVQELDFPSGNLLPQDFARLEVIPFSGVAELSETIERLVLIRNLGLSEAAKRLQREHSTLSEWMRAKNRRFIT